MADITTLPNQKMSVHKLVNQINTEDRLETRLSYRSLISNLHINKPELTQPENEKLLCRLDACNKIFKDVRTPREGVLDIIALKTISSFARIQTVAIDKKSTTTDAFKLMRKCGKIIKNNFSNCDNPFVDFYVDFCHCHKTAGAMNFMSGRLPTFWFEKRSLEISLLSQRTRHTKEIIDTSQYTQIQEIKKLSPSGEQTSQEVIRMNQQLEQAYEKNNNEPVNFFMFTIHPKLFSRSVENIFHVSFLIKEGKAELFLDENQLPVLRPMKKPDTQNHNSTTINQSASDKIHSLTQLVLSLDIEQWETLVDVFHIQTAMISDKV